MWRKQVGEMYVGRNLCLLKVKGKELLRLEHSPTLPVAAVLAEMSEQCNDRSIDLSKLSLRFDLSAELCQGYTIDTEPNQLSIQDREGIANALAIPSTNLALKRCATHQKLLAVTTLALIDAMSRWTAQHRADLSSIQPLWARVSYANRAKLGSVKAIVLQEPAGSALIEEGSPPNWVPTWQFVSKKLNVGADTTDQQIVEASALKNSEVVFFKFNPSGEFGIEQGLPIWSGHWGSE